MADAVLALLIIGGVATLLGAIFLAIGVIRGRIISGWTSTTGVIVNRDGSTGGLPALYPTFEWHDANGVAHRRTSIVRSSLGPRPGRQVSVRFDPANPDRAMIDTFVQSGRIFILIGALILVFGLLLLAAATAVWIS